MNTYETWKILRDRLPRLIDALCFDPKVDLPAWNHVLDTKLLPRFSPEFPVVVAVAGAGSTGKSTLFNALAGQELAVVGATAGLTRRVLIGLHPQLLDRHEFLSELFYPFGCIPEPFQHRSELTEPGPPKYVSVDTLPPTIALLDTPDFDVGMNGKYLNRDIAKPVMEASDVLVYIFTNSVYNNLAGGRFLHEVAATLGKRKCVLVYRCYESFEREEVLDHCNVVAEKLYGETYSQFVLAKYRTHDTNDVASGKSSMQLCSLDDDRTLLDVLGRLNPHQVHIEQTVAARADALGQARIALDNAKVANWGCELYRDAIRIKQADCVTKALEKLPLRDILKQVIYVWKQTSPGPLKVLRGVGTILGSPVRIVLDFAQWVKDRIGGDDEAALEEDPLQARLADVQNAASEFHRALLSDAIDAHTTNTDRDGLRVLQTIANIRRLSALQPHELPRVEEAGGNHRNIYVAAHAVAASVRNRLMGTKWEDTLDSISDEVRQILTDSPDDELTCEITKIVENFRNTMGLLKKVRETFFAALQVVPPIVAVAYVLLTGDPVGGGGIWAKVHGLFGLNDLWAVVSLPTNLGLSEVDRKQLEHLLTPVIGEWISRRAKQVDQVFTQKISFELLAELEKAIDGAKPLLTELEKAINTLEKAHA